MKDESSWIYVVIMIALSLISTLGKKKKQPNLEKTPPINQEKEEDEYSPINTRPVRVEPRKIRRKEKIAEPSVTPTTKHELLNDISQSIHAQQKEMPPIEADRNNPMTIKFDSNEQIRKAFIYSEIFGKKY